LMPHGGVFRHKHLQHNISLRNLNQGTDKPQPRFY
jgi:hypothetical protein